MDIDSYMTMTCSYEKKLEEDSEMLTPTYDTAVNIKCFRYGDTRNIRGAFEHANFSDQTYLLAQEVFVGDKIDGQVVASVFLVPDFDGSSQLYEVHLMTA